MKYLLGIDFGGGSSKATLIDTLGNIVAESTTEYPTYYPVLGACEQSPEDWSRSLSENIAQLLLKSKIDSGDILALSIDSATHTAVLCDKEYKPLRNAIHCTDTRSRKQAKYLKDNYGDFIFSKSFHKPDTIWTMPEILWVKEGVYCTDYIDAQGSMLFDCNDMCWSKELCDLIGLDVNVLPPVKAPTDVIGSVTKEAAEYTGLKEGTPVICGTTDTVMEVFASGSVNKGDVTVKLATAGRVCVITDRPFPRQHLVNYSHITGGLWYPGTATKAAASSYRWYRDTFGGSYSDLNVGAEQVPIGCEGLIYHPYINGELTPYSDPLLCGSFTGIRATHTKGRFTRSVLEGVALSLLHSKKTLDEIGIPVGKKGTVIGGGAKGELWRQITADCLNMELTLTESSDSSLGSAMLAGVAVGVFASPEDAVKKCFKPIGVTKPNVENNAKYEKLFEEYVAIHDALAPIYDKREL